VQQRVGGAAEREGKREDGNGRRGDEVKRRQAGFDCGAALCWAAVLAQASSERDLRIK